MVANRCGRGKELGKVPDRPLSAPLSLPASELTQSRRGQPKSSILPHVPCKLCNYPNMCMPNEGRVGLCFLLPLNPLNFRYPSREYPRERKKYRR